MNQIIAATFIGGNDAAIAAPSMAIVMITIIALFIAVLAFIWIVFGIFAYVEKHF